MTADRQPKGEFHDELLSLYRRTGEATGYWPSYFLRSVRREGGFAVAKTLLAPGRVSSGFDKLVGYRRADLSVEAIALEGRFSHLFTSDELGEARRRLDTLPAKAFPEFLAAVPGLSEEIPTRQTYPVGSVQRVLVNQYERNPRARAACIRHHGAQCTVCDFDFENRYGERGRGYIHVHHKRPLSSLPSTYRLDPKNDLVPVCPNCHAMLHRREPPLDVEQLRPLLRLA